MPGWNFIFIPMFSLISQVFLNTELRITYKISQNGENSLTRGYVPLLDFGLDFGLILYRIRCPFHEFIDLITNHDKASHDVTCTNIIQSALTNIKEKV
jgi:hypothetical protein